MARYSEADTCRKFVVPKLQAAGWDDDPHSIAEQRTITDGRIVAELDSLLSAILDRISKGKLKGQGLQRATAGNPAGDWFAASNTRTI